MRPDKSESFTFCRNIGATSSERNLPNYRLKVQQDRQKCENATTVCTANANESRSERRVLSVLNLNDTRRAFKTGAEKISKTFTSVRTTFGSISQKFKASTRRRQILEEGPMTPNCATPQTYSRAVLGRTPAQMYSPFGIECTDSAQKENQQQQTPTRSPRTGTANNLKKRNLMDSLIAD